MPEVQVRLTSDGVHIHSDSLFSIPVHCEISKVTGSESASEMDLQQ